MRTYIWYYYYIYIVICYIGNGINTHSCRYWKHSDGQLRVSYVQYIPRNMHTVFALLCFVVVIHWLIFPYPSGLLHWHCGNLTIAPMPAKQPWWIWINTSCKFIMNDCITTTKQSTTKPCAYFLGYTVHDTHTWTLKSSLVSRFCIQCWYLTYFSVASLDIMKLSWTNSSSRFKFYLT